MLHLLRSLRVCALLVAGLGCLAACGGPETAVDRVDEVGGPEASGNLRRVGVRYAAELPALLSARLDAERTTFELRSILDAGGATPERDAARAAALASLYEAAAGPHFVDRGGLNQRGRALRARLARIERDALSPAWFRRAELDAAVTALAALPDEGVNLMLRDADAQQFIDWWLAKGAQLESGERLEVLLDEHRSPVRAVSEAWRNARDRQAARDAALLRVESLSASALVRLAWAMRGANTAYVTPAERAEHGWTLDSDEQRAEAVQWQTTSLVLDIARSGEPAGRIDALTPPFEQYARLVDAYARYGAIVRSGGWPEIDRASRLRRDQGGPLVPLLRQRLAVEGFVARAEGGSTLDAGLVQAVRAFQRTHQLPESGELDEATAASLGVTATRRLSQIGVTLQRWRETRIGYQHHDTFILVNVPEFYAELRDNGELVHRWKVIVGKYDLTAGPDGTRVQAGLTPLISNQVRYVVFNPYWVVPDEIRRHEYAPLIRRNPHWLAQHGFEYHTDAHGKRWLRQRPGPQNLLGEVKFIFPNEHGVYMHDTPAKTLFDRPVRPFSHGCIRAEGPLELAAILLRRDRGWTAARARDFVDDMVEGDHEEWVGLRHPVPIHVEYYNVHVDDDGRTSFMTDIYRLDMPRVDAFEASLGVKAPTQEVSLVDVAVDGSGAEGP